MMRSLWTAASGMMAQQLNIDTISNNLANVNTTAFKKSRAEFEDLMYQTLNIAGNRNQGGGRAPTGIQVGMGVGPGSVHKFYEQGDFQNTGNPLDVAIQGDGFFQVEVNGELHYTRAGNFKLNQDGQVVTSDGHPLQPPFNVPPETTSISISGDGHIAAMNDAGEELAGADIPVYVFANPAGLNSVGNNMVRQTEASGPAQQLVPGTESAGTLKQGFLEKSNVEIVEEMVDMIMAQRSFETNSKAIKTSDQMLRTANQLVR